MPVTSTSVAYDDIRIGDVVRVKLVVSIHDWAEKKDKNGKIITSRSSRQRILDGHSINRPSIVLRKLDVSRSLVVAYYATFNKNLSLPDNLDPLMWYPMSPALDSHLDALPSFHVEQVPTWVSIRTRHIYHTQEGEDVTVLQGLHCPDSTIELIEHEIKSEGTTQTAWAPDLNVDE